MVGGELFNNEPVVGKIIVEGRDHVIAVRPGPGEDAVLKEDVPLGVGIAGNVQPVAAPAFAVVWVGQQSVDFGGPSPGIGQDVGIGQQVAGRESQQVEPRPPHQRAMVGCGRWSDFRRRQSLPDEGVDGVAGPAIGVGDRDLRSHYRPQRPGAFGRSFRHCAERCDQQDGQGGTKVGWHKHVLSPLLTSGPCRRPHRPRSGRCPAERLSGILRCGIYRP